MDPATNLHCLTCGITYPVAKFGHSCPVCVKAIPPTQTRYADQDDLTELVFYRGVGAIERTMIRSSPRVDSDLCFVTLAEVGDTSPLDFEEHIARKISVGGSSIPDSAWYDLKILGDPQKLYLENNKLMLTPGSPHDVQLYVEKYIRTIGPINHGESHSPKALMLWVSLIDQYYPKEIENLQENKIAGAKLDISKLRRKKIPELIALKILGHDISAFESGHFKAIPMEGLGLAFALSKNIAAINCCRTFSVHTCGVKFSAEEPLYLLLDPVPTLPRLTKVRPVEVPAGLWETPALPGYNWLRLYSAKKNREAHAGLVAAMNARAYQKAMESPPEYREDVTKP